MSNSWPLSRRKAKRDLVDEQAALLGVSPQEVFFLAYLQYYNGDRPKAFVESGKAYEHYRFKIKGETGIRELRKRSAPIPEAVKVFCEQSLEQAGVCANPQCPDRQREITYRFKRMTPQGLAFFCSPACMGLNVDELLKTPEKGKKVSTYLAENTPPPEIMVPLPGQTVRRVSLEKPKAPLKNGMRVSVRERVPVGNGDAKTDELSLEALAAAELDDEPQLDKLMREDESPDLGSEQQ